MIPGPTPLNKVKIQFNLAKQTNPSWGFLFLSFCFIHVVYKTFITQIVVHWRAFVGLIVNVGLIVGLFVRTYQKQIVGHCRPFHNFHKKHRDDKCCMNLAGEFLNVHSWTLQKCGYWNSEWSEFEKVYDNVGQFCQN